MQFGKRNRSTTARTVCALQNVLATSVPRSTVSRVDSCQEKTRKTRCRRRCCCCLGCRISTAHILYMWLWHAILHIGQLRSEKNAKHQYINNAKGKWLCQSAQFQSSIAFWSDTEALLFGYIRRGVQRAFSDRHFVCLFLFLLTATWNKYNIKSMTSRLALYPWIHVIIFHKANDVPWNEAGKLDLHSTRNICSTSFDE